MAGYVVESPIRPCDSVITGAAFKGFKVVYV